MKPQVRIALIIASAGAAALIAAKTVRAKETIPAGPQNKSAQTHKVWTNDDLIALRTPTDTYVIEHEAESPAILEKAKPSIESSKPNDRPVLATPATIHLPETAEETQRMIDQELRDINAEEASFSQLQQRMDAARGQERETIQRQIERLKGNLEAGRQELKVLQDHLDMLKKKADDNKLAAPSQNG
jgi:HSP90 family molecular chaperone